jgi:hypothetical protein
MYSTSKAAASLAAAILTFAGVPAHAATIIQNFSGPGSYSVAKFDPSLGTLNAITANITGGFARYLFELTGPLNAPVGYTATAYYGIYLGPLTIDGNTQGAGTATFVNGTAEIELPVVPYTRNITVPTNPMSAAYNALIGVGSTFSTLTVDPPFTISFGGLGGFSIDNVEILARSATWNLVYDYTPTGPEVPEPATWTTMLLGFALVGGVLRSRRRRVAVGWA